MAGSNVDTKEFYQLRERVGLVQSDVSHVLERITKQNGHIKELAQAIEELSEKVADNERSTQPLRAHGGAIAQIIVALLTAIVITVALRLLGI